MKHIDKIFKEKLYNHESEVPEGMWEKIAPIAEEESGRAILWFWFAGLLTLLLGGLGIYKMTSESLDTTIDPSTLVQDSQDSNQSTDLVVDNSLMTEEATNTQKEIDLTEEVVETSTVSNTSTSNIDVVESTPTPPSTKVIVNEAPKKPTLVQSAPTFTSSTSDIFSNIVETIPNVEGTPANLVITKSYINNAGSIIKQSNLSDESANEGPVYDVIINSEAKDLNAGALLRIIEPLENIPLPAFQKKLKKKNIQISL